MDWLQPLCCDPKPTKSDGFQINLNLLKNILRGLFLKWKICVLVMLTGIVLIPIKSEYATQFICGGMLYAGILIISRNHVTDSKPDKPFDIHEFINKWGWLLKPLIVFILIPVIITIIWGAPQGFPEGSIGEPDP